MRNRCSFVKSESGQILIWVIGAMVLASLIIAPLLLSAFGGFRTSTIRQERMQELYAADTGIEDALNWIYDQGKGNLTRLNESGFVTLPEVHQQFSYPLGFDTNDGVIDVTELSNINGCNVRITGERTGNLTYTVTSTATNLVNRGHLKVQVKVEIDTLTIPGSLITQPPVLIYPQSPPGGPFSYAIASLGDGEQFVGAPGGTIDGDIFINGNFNTSPSGGGTTTVTGNLYCDGDITLDLSSHVVGNASATGNIVLLSSSIIDGNAWANTYISQASKNYIGKDAYAQTYINASKGSINGSAWANGNITVSSAIHQSAFANNNINVPGGSILGWAYYLNSLNISNGGFVGNSSKLNQAAYVPPALMPAIQPNPDPGAVYYGNATTGPGHTTITGNKNISGTVHLGPTYITGDLTFSNNGILWLDGTVYVHGKIDMDSNGCRVLATPGTVTPAVLVADGSITIKNNNIATPDINMPLIMSVYGDITCKNNNYVVGALYAPNGTATIMNNTIVDGAIVAKKIVNNNNYSVTYNPIVQSIPGLPGASGPGPAPSPYPSPVPPIYGPTITVPTGVLVTSYVVLEE